MDMRQKILTLAVCAMGLTGVARAGDMAECVKIQDTDKKHFCLASYAGSGTYCDKINNGELRRDCMFKVVRVQREVTYKPAKPKPPVEE
jgi:hypothetical protein